MHREHDIETPRGLPLLLRAPGQGGWGLTGGRLLMVLLLVWGSWGFFTRDMRGLTFDPPGLLHGVNLVFHEAGHIIFAIFQWPLLTALGGTLMQILFPYAICMAFVLAHENAFGAAVMLWWAGQNFVDCAPYINDARMLQLTLLGGGTGREVEGHDWDFILTQLNILNWDIHIARVALAFGRGVMVLAIVWAVVVAILNHRRHRAGSQARM